MRLLKKNNKTNNKDVEVKKVYLPKVCNRCGNRVRSWHNSIKDLVNGKTCCGSCQSNFFYDVSVKEWFFSLDYAQEYNHLRTRYIRRISEKVI